MNKIKISKLLNVGAFSLIIICALLITGSLAKEDLSQHKTNVIEASNEDYNAVLVEDFQSKIDWSISEEPIKNEVRVRNGQESDVKEDAKFKNIYVRLQFKEYMEMASKEPEYSKLRYVLDDEDNFIKFDTEEEALEYIEQHKDVLPTDTKIHKIKSYTDTKEYFYLESKLKDHNGKYGKHVLLNVIQRGSESLVPGVIKGDPGHDLSHQDITVIEDFYSIHRWDRDKEEQGYAKDSPFSEYVHWNLGSDVLTFSQWKADGFPTVNAWIIDDLSVDGWVYWGSSLTHSIDEIADPDSITSAFLESVELIKQPEKDSEYYMHVNLDSVAKESLSLWYDAPQELITYLKAR